MKKLLMVTMITLTSLTSFAQLQKVSIPKETTIGKVAPAGVFLLELTYNVNEISSDTLYTLTYRNAEYMRIDSYESIKFNGGSETLNAFYDMLKGAFLAEDIKTYNQEAKLGTTLISVSGYKSMGVKGVRFVTPKGYINAITESQLNKLFGK
jgi:hypothetical protein